MADELQILKNRFRELSTRSNNRGIYFYSDFLNLYEQTVLYNEIKSGFSLYGGFSDAERKIAVFGSEDEFGFHLLDFDLRSLLDLADLEGSVSLAIEIDVLVDAGLLFVIPYIPVLRAHEIFNILASSCRDFLFLCRYR